MTARWAHTGYAQRIEFGAGALATLPDLLKSTGARRVLLVTTAGRAASDDGERVVRTLGRTLASTFADAASHVPTPVLQAALLQSRRDGVDAIVSFGGGSCADLGKAISFFTEQEAGTPGVSWTDRPLLPHIAIPTTYSGAELTPVFGMTDPHTRQKSGAGGPTSAPIGTVHDPDLTRSTPPRVSAETGMNALAHCVEALWSRTRTPEADAIAFAGARRIWYALPGVVADPDDLDGRTTMLEGAVLAGRCLQNASMGVHHGLSQLVGGRTGIPHGLANAVILPHAIRFNAGAAPAAIARFGAAIGVDGGHPDEVADAVEAFVAGLGLPTRLVDCGLDPLDLELDLDAVARLSQSNASVRANPRAVSEDDARTLLDQAT